MHGEVRICYEAILPGIFGTVCTVAAVSVQADQIGEVSTTSKILGANDTVVIKAFNDPDISGVTCYVSRAGTGRITPESHFHNSGRPLVGIMV